MHWTGEQLVRCVFVCFVCTGPSFLLVVSLTALRSFVCSFVRLFVRLFSGQHTFLRDHLGPTFAAQNLTETVGIFLATFPVNDYAGYIAPALTDPEALKYLSGIGLQYPGLGMIAAIRNETAAKRPDLKLWETETPCGG
eukprot:SAG22_NODE_9019_length_614_cov_1.143689_1_plen_138_part_10